LRNITKNSVADIRWCSKCIDVDVINVEVKMMEKKEFLSICDSALKEMGFSKKGGVAL